MAPKHVRDNVSVARDLIALKRDQFEVECPTLLLAEMIRSGYGLSAPGEALQGLAVAIADAIIDSAATARPYDHHFNPVYEVVLRASRAEHIVLNAGTPEVHNYPRDTAH